MRVESRESFLVSKWKCMRIMYRYIMTEVQQIMDEFKTEDCLYRVLSYKTFRSIITKRMEPNINKRQERQAEVDFIWNKTLAKPLSLVVREEMGNIMLRSMLDCLPEKKKPMTDVHVKVDYHEIISIIDEKRMLLIVSMEKKAVQVLSELEGDAFETLWKQVKERTASDEMEKNVSDIYMESLDEEAHEAMLEYRALERLCYRDESDMD